MHDVRPALLLCTTMLVIGCTDDGGGTEEVGETSSSTTSSTTTSETDDGSETSESSDTTQLDTDTSDTTQLDTDTSETGPEPVCGNGIVEGDEQCDDGNGFDNDECKSDCTPAVCGDGIIQVGVENCDDSNMLDGDGCSAICITEGCGDGIVQGEEECDDANAVTGDECTNLCTIAACGDGIIQDGVEMCDDGNLLDEDECLASCVPALCGDGVVWEGEEECDDANDVDSDACLSACTLAACGDGVLQDGVEQCDDGNGNSFDGCTNQCVVGEIIPLDPKVLQCGDSQRPIADFIPEGLEFQIVESCTPDADTQAMFVSRNGQVNPAQVKAYVEAGGRVITEVFISDDVYNAVFQANVGEVGFTGSCQDTAPTVVQFTANDPFWNDNAFQMIGLDETGCGNNVASYPGLVPLAGWSVNQVSIGYRNAGMGRVWVTEFDWQDNDTVGVAYDYTESLLGYMITSP
jgi:cysteine-rich repeat protein